MAFAGIVLLSEDKQCFCTSWRETSTNVPRRFDKHMIGNPLVRRTGLGDERINRTTDGINGWSEEHIEIIDGEFSLKEGSGRIEDKEILELLELKVESPVTSNGRFEKLGLWLGQHVQNGIPWLYLELSKSGQLKKCLITNFKHLIS